MLELARGGCALGKVLEIGTGCGYQAALLSRLAKEVYSLERIAQLLTRARVTLRELRIQNVRLRHADGSRGSQESGPFDAIVMAAAAPQVPQPLLDQLAPGGRLVLPVGSRTQHLTLVERGEQGFVQTVLETVRFVPLLPGAPA
jgi:protein-L-isoaspartate(D-aspartate) O-methyltransferase